MAKQQEALGQAQTRERQMLARIDALSEALAEQGRAHAEERRTLAQRIDALEHAVQARDGDVRATRLALRNVAIGAGVAPPRDL